MQTIETLALEQVTYSVREKAIVRDISYTWKLGTTCALLGVSGSGKSTLLHLLAGFHNPTYGTIWYGNQAHNNLSEQERGELRLRLMGYVTQNACLLPECSVLENVMLSGLIAGYSRTRCAERAYHLLERVGLTAQAYAYPATLSGGEQQRVALARALWNNPPWLLLDEPTAHLDAHAKKQMLALLLDMQVSSGTGIIVATHDDEVASAMRHTVRIKDGMIEE